MNPKGYTYRPPVHVVPQQICQDCGDQFEFPPDSPQCTNCWEVKRRLEDFLRKSYGNREYVRNLLKKYEGRS